MIRDAKRTLTGNPVCRIEVVLGTRRDGSPGVTIFPIGYRREPIPLSSPEVLEALIADLQVAQEHLRGTPA